MIFFIKSSIACPYSSIKLKLNKLINNPPINSNAKQTPMKVYRVFSSSDLIILEFHLII